MDFQFPLMLVQNKIRAEGGREIDRFRGVANPMDTCNGAEAWIGSVTRANGATKEHPNLGCAEVLLPDGSRTILRDLVRENARQILGDKHMEKYGPDLGMLIKLLDAKAQFLLQCHPTRETARQYWNSSYGKEECWYVIGIRDDVPEPPHILLGFKEGITAEAFEKAYREGTVKDLEAMCNKIIVHPGQAFLIPGGVPHALGVGCFVAEIQEPSDLTAVPIPQEALLAFRRNANPLGVFVAEDEALYETRMLHSFIFEGQSLETVKQRYLSKERLLRQIGDSTEVEIFGEEDTECFSSTIVNVRGQITRQYTGDVQIGILLSGEGIIRCGEYVLNVKQGDEIFFPYNVQDAVFEGSFSIILCNPGITANYKPE